MASLEHREHRQLLKLYLRLAVIYNTMLLLRSRELILWESVAKTNRANRQYPQSLLSQPIIRGLRQVVLSLVFPSHLVQNC